MEFSPPVVFWYHQNKRNLPWRNTRNPFKIWLSEIILQQTRVEQGLPYYHRFTEEFPTVKELANASEQNVLKLWQGLGYYSRARNLHSAAKQIMEEFNGDFPSTYTQLLKLKGVGEYTAAAIASFSFNEAVPVLDGNVYRLISRYFGIKEPINTPKARSVFTELLKELIKGHPPADFNQAIMEFGSQMCKPGIPDCSVCPLAQGCFAFKNRCITELPVKEKKVKVKEIYLYYFVIKSKGKVIMRKRSGSGIWRNLYDFPCIESDKKLSLKLLKAQQEKLFMGLEKSTWQLSEVYKHVLSHRLLHVCFIEVTVNSLRKFTGNDCNIFSFASVEKLPLPRVIDKYITNSPL